MDYMLKRNIQETYLRFHNRSSELDSLTFNEWCVLEGLYDPEGKYREFDSDIAKGVKYGISFLFAGPIGLLLYHMYRQWTDECKKLCNEQGICYNNCYYTTCKRILSKIEDDYRRIDELKDASPEKKQKMKIKLKKHYVLWAKRTLHFKEKYEQSKAYGR